MYKVLVTNNILMLQNFHHPIFTINFIHKIMYLLRVILVFSIIKLLGSKTDFFFGGVGFQFDLVSGSFSALADFLVEYDVAGEGFVVEAVVFEAFVDVIKRYFVFVNGLRWVIRYIFVVFGRKLHEICFFLSDLILNVGATGARNDNTVTGIC